MVEISPYRFERLVRDAIDLLPEDLAAAMDNVAIQIRDRHPEDAGLLGLYEGTPLTERDDYSGFLPDVIWIYRLAICEMCQDSAEVVDEVRITVLHELAHHFGIDDDRLDELGWS